MDDSPIASFLVRDAISGLGVGVSWEGALARIGGTQSATRLIVMMEFPDCKFSDHFATRLDESGANCGQ